MLELNGLKRWHGCLSERAKLEGGCSDCPWVVRLVIVLRVFTWLDLGPGQRQLLVSGELVLLPGCQIHYPTADNPGKELTRLDR